MYLFIFYLFFIFIYLFYLKVIFSHYNKQTVMSCKRHIKWSLVLQLVRIHIRSSSAESDRFWFWSVFFFFFFFLGLSQPPSAPLQADWSILSDWAALHRAAAAGGGGGGGRGGGGRGGGGETQRKEPSTRTYRQRLEMKAELCLPPSHARWWWRWWWWWWCYILFIRIFKRVGGEEEEEEGEGGGGAGGFFFFFFFFFFCDVALNVKKTTEPLTGWRSAQRRSLRFGCYHERNRHGPAVEDPRSAQLRLLQGLVVVEVSADRSGCD